MAFVEKGHQRLLPPSDIIISGGLKYRVKSGYQFLRTPSDEVAKSNGKCPSIAKMSLPHSKWGWTNPKKLAGSIEFVRWYTVGSDIGLCPAQISESLSL